MVTGRRLYFLRLFLGGHRWSAMMKRRYKTTEYKVYPDDGFNVDMLPSVR